MSLLGKKVRKIGGSFEHTGTVVSEFKTSAGEDRIVVEFDPPVSGMLHIYRLDQVEAEETTNDVGPRFLEFMIRRSSCPACGSVSCNHEEGLVHSGARRYLRAFSQETGYLKDLK